MFRILFTVFIALCTVESFCQSVVDSCFASAEPAINFESGEHFVNVYHADLIEWDGEEWIGSLPAGMMEIPPPLGEIGCRAFGLGSGTIWTPGGERIAFEIEEPFQAGLAYSFTFTYVSHGVGSDGAFSPRLLANDAPEIEGSVFIGNLTPVGDAWETHSFSFTASNSMEGSNWVIIETDETVSTGIVSSFCADCVPCPINLNIGNDTILCTNETLLLDAAKPDATYQWQDESEDSGFTVTEPGKYWVDVITDDCTLSDTIDVAYLSIPEIELGGDTTLCFGVSLSLDATFVASEYLWNDESDEEELVVSAAGSYWVEVSNMCGMDRDTIQVDYFSNEDIDLGVDTILCDGAILVLDATTPDATYLWQDDSEGASFQPSADGLYWVDVVKNGCLYQDTIAVSFIDSISLNLGNDTILCQGTPLVLTATADAAEYQWHDDSNEDTFEVTKNGLYWVEVSNVCHAQRDSIDVQFTYTPDANLGPDTVVCDGASVVLGAPPQLANYQWQDGSDDSFYTAADDGLYWLQIDNACGSSRDSVLVIYEYPLDVYIGEDSTICAGSSLTLVNGVEAPSFYWQDGSTSENFVVSNTGTYWLAVENSCGVFIDSIDVYVLEPPSVYLGPDGELCPGDSIVLDASFDQSEYLWQDLSTSPQFTAYYPESYGVVVTNQCGTAEDFIDFDCVQIQIPNVFSPNGDGYNDVLIPFIQGDLSQYSFVVYNRWGQLLFETKEQSKGWDGTESPEGVYYAIVHYVDYLGMKRSVSMDVMLKQE